MLRALLVFLGCQAAGGDPAQVLAGAGGIELVHAASLIHDDIMDGASLRRDLPALHTTLGVARAIVCGDYLIAKAFRLLAESRSMNPAAHVVEAFIIGAESGIRVCTGQFHDVGHWSAADLTEENYYRVIANKTAAAISGALRAGAVLAGAEQGLLDALSRYGECVGLAFQIKDDLLDLASVADNVRAIDPKISLPLIHAFQHTDERGREIIGMFLGQQSVAGRQMADVIAANDSLAYAEAAAAAQAEEAIRLARAIPQIGEALEAFAHYAVLRDQ
jgi:geranylgeranyl diphosphate synthase type I